MQRQPPPVSSISRAHIVRLLAGMRMMPIPSRFGVCLLAAPAFRYNARGLHSDAFLELPQSSTGSLPLPRLEAGTVPQDAAARLDEASDDDDFVMPDLDLSSLCTRCEVDEALRLSCLWASARMSDKVALPQLTALPTCVEETESAVEVSQSTSVVPQLPTELIDLIVAYALLGFRSKPKRTKAKRSKKSEDRQARMEKESLEMLKALLHTTHRIREDVMSHFNVRVKFAPERCVLEVKDDFPTYKVNAAIEPFVADAANFLLRASNAWSKPLAIPQSDGGILTTPKSAEVRCIKFSITIAVQQVSMLSSSSDPAPMRSSAKRIVSRSSEPLTMTDACEVLVEAINDMTLSRDLNPHYRASNPEKTPRVYMSVLMELPESGHSELWFLRSHQQVVRIDKSRLYL